MPAIRTPGPPAPILISSTMTELANTRAAVRTAIERLRLIPVLFELGDWPYPPRELYLAYLRQSDSAGCDLDSTGVHVQRIWVAAEWPVAFGNAWSHSWSEMGSSRVAMEPQKGRSCN